QGGGRRRGRAGGAAALRRVGSHRAVAARGAVASRQEARPGWRASPDAMTRDPGVIVVSYNTRDLTLQAVASARRATDGLDARVIVADNGSAGESRRASG